MKHRAINRRQSSTTATTKGTKQMAGKNTAVFGIFTSRTQAEQAIDALMSAGFRSDDISVLAPDQHTTKELATEKNTKAPEGATAGATTGGVVGGTLGLLAGI